MPLLTPTPSTLKKYGLPLEVWQTMADQQGHACAVCKQEPTKGRLCIDHEHVKGWKKMIPSERVKYVRALLCFRCNTTYMGRGITVERSRGVTAVLEEYSLRRPDPVQSLKLSKALTSKKTPSSAHDEQSLRPRSPPCQIICPLASPIRSSPNDMPCTRTRPGSTPATESPAT